MTEKNKDIDPKNLLEENKRLAKEIEKLRKQKLNDYKYRILFENSHNPVFVINKDQVIDCNQSAVNLLKAIDRDQIIGYPVYDYFPDQSSEEKDSVDLLKSNMKRALKEKTMVFESEIIDFDKNRVPVEISFTAIPFHDIIMLFTVMRDITLFKKTQIQLKSSEAKYKAIFHSTSEAIFIHAYHSGKILEVNEGAKSIFGYSKKEFRKLTVADLSLGSSPYSQKEAMVYIQNTVEKGPQVFEWKSKTKDGKIFWSEVSLKVMSIDKEKFVIAVVRDIDKRKKYEIEFLHEKEFIKILFDTSPAFHVAINSDGKTMMMNKAMLNALGYNEEDVIGKNYLKKFVPEDEHDMLSEIFSNLTDDKKPTINENHIICKNGKMLLVEWHGRPIMDYKGEFELFIGMGIEVTSKMKAETKLKESEEKFRLLFETAGDSIFLMDDEIFIDCNEQTLVMFNCERDQIIGQPPYKYSPPKQPDGRDSMEKAMEKINAAKKGEPQIFEWKHKKYDGSLFDAEVSLNLVKLSKKKYIQAIVRDISERKIWEKEIKSLNEELEQRVKQRTAELQAAYNDLQDFAYITSHDLKSPLRGIGQIAQWLSQDYKQIIDEKGKELIDLLLDRVEKMYNLIESVLQYSKIGKTPTKDREIDVNEVLESLIGFMDIPGHVKIKIKSSLPSIVFDKIRLQQVFQNLIDNAIQYNDKEKPKIEIGGKEEGNFWKFYVKDNGPGIKEKYQDKIFAIFQSLSSDKSSENTGVGLAIVKKIIELYNGQIWLESKMKKGSTFYFTIEKREIPEIN